jgi:integrase/recombinase XerC
MVGFSKEWASFSAAEARNQARLRLWIAETQTVAVAKHRLREFDVTPRWYTGTMKGRSRATTAGHRLEIRSLADSELVPLVLAGDQAGWREVMRRFDGPLRQAVTDAALDGEIGADVDDLMGEFWLGLVERDMRRLKRFNPRRGAPLLTWLTIHLVQLLRAQESARAASPRFENLDSAKNLPAQEVTPLDSGPTSWDDARAGGFFESSRATDGGSSEEEPMYQKLYGPYLKEGKFKVHAYLLDGTKKYLTFPSEDDANAFIKVNERRTVANPVTMAAAVKEYVASRTDLKESSRTTLRFRLEALMQGHAESFVQTFAVQSVWRKLAASNAVDTLHGIRSAASGFFRWCVKTGYLKKDPLGNVEIVGKKRKGKAQLRLDEARALLKQALRIVEGERIEGRRDGVRQDIAALAVATALLLGLRNGEVVARRVRDLDDDGKILVIDEAKTAAGVRRVEVPDILRLHVQKLAERRRRADQLFDGMTKDALRWWTRRLCKAAGLPEVTPHGLRGTNATASMKANSNPHLVAAALGHESIAVTMRHYVDRDEVEASRQQAAVDALVH